MCTRIKGISTREETRIFFSFSFLFLSTTRKASSTTRLNKTLRNQHAFLPRTRATSMQRILLRWLKLDVSFLALDLLIFIVSKILPRIFSTNWTRECSRWKGYERFIVSNSYGRIAHPFKILWQSDGIVLISKRRNIQGGNNRKKKLFRKIFKWFAAFFIISLRIFFFLFQTQLYYLIYIKFDWFSFDAWLSNNV